MHEVLVNRLGGLSLPRKRVIRLTDRHDMTLDVYRGRKTTTQQQQHGVCEYQMLLSGLVNAHAGLSFFIMSLFLFVNAIKAIPTWTAHKK